MLLSFAGRGWLSTAGMGRSRERDRRRSPPRRKDRRSPSRRSSSRSRSRPRRSKKEERPKTIEELRRERKAREAANTPEAKLAAFKLRVAEDARQLLEDEERRKEEAEKAEQDRTQQAALAELAEAVCELRRLASEGETGGLAVRSAKMRVAVATKAAAALGIPQDDIVAASAPPKPPPEPEPPAHISAEEALDRELARVATAEKEKEAAKPKDDEAPAIGEAPSAEDAAEDAAKGEEEKKPKLKIIPPKQPSKRALVQKAAHEAAIEAKEGGEPPANVAKAATSSAKMAGGDAEDIMRAAKDGVKIANGEQPVMLPEYEEKESETVYAKDTKVDGGKDDDSSSSSSDSYDSERELPIAENDKAKAKREGIAAAFYFGVR